MAKFKISGNFVGALVFAIALWGYTSLNDSYITFVEVPLSIELPQDRAIENDLPSFVTLELKGSGWNLFNLIFFNSAKICKVDLRDENNLSDYSISRQLMIKSSEFMANVETRDVLPASIDLITGRILEKKVPIKFVGEISAHPDFIITSEHNIEPKEVVIRGNENIIRDIKFWKTKPFHLGELSKSGEMKIKLSDSLSQIVKRDIDFVKLNTNIEQRAEIILENIPISISGRLPKSINIQPNKVDIVLRGGLSQLENFDISQVLVQVNSKDILRNKTGIIVPNISIKNTKIKAKILSPQFLYLIKKDKNIANN